MSGAENEKLETMASELNVRISQERVGLLFLMNTQFRKAKDNAINYQILTQIQLLVRATNAGQLGERPDTDVGCLNRAVNNYSSKNNISEVSGAECMMRGVRTKNQGRSRHLKT